jgi:hypothetical protein
MIILSYLSLLMSLSHPLALIPTACPVIRGARPQPAESFLALAGRSMSLPCFIAPTDRAIRPPFAHRTSTCSAVGTPPSDAHPNPIRCASLTARTLLALLPLLTPRQPPLGGVWSQERQPQWRAVTLARLSLALPRTRLTRPPQNRSRNFLSIYSYYL